MLKNYGIILASGSGSRFGSEIPKQFMMLDNKTILEYSIDTFENSDSINEIILIVTPSYLNEVKKIVNTNKYTKVSKILAGGETRKDSSYIGISAIEDNEANVLIHDCARPLLSEKIIEACTKSLEIYEAVDVAIPTTDTILEIKDGIIKSIPERKNLMSSQTPQCFRLSLIKKAHELSKNDKSFTDDCGLVLKHDLAKIHIVEGEFKNFKITYPFDIKYAEILLESQ